jgi:hypothetical protein
MVPHPVGISAHHPSSRPRRLRTRGARPMAAAGVATLAALTFGTSSALAVGGYHTSGAGVRVRATASSQATQVSAIATTGTAIDISCQLKAETVTATGFGTSAVWDKLNGYGNGYISDLFVRETPYGQLDSRLPVCPPSGGTSAPPSSASTAQMRAAAAWAIAEKNSPNPAWSDHFGHYWSGWCEQFAEQAEGFTFRFASATLDYQWQAARHRIHTDTNPPVGALVYYAGGNGAGHVAVSIGNGQAVGTYGYSQPQQRLPVRQYPVVGFLSNPYLGWANPIGS